MTNTDHTYIRAIRSALGMTQKDFAKQLGLKMRQITNIETGRVANLTTTRLAAERIAISCGVTQEQLDNMKGITHDD